MRTKTPTTVCAHLCSTLFAPLPLFARHCFFPQHLAATVACPSKPNLGPKIARLVVPFPLAAAGNCFPHLPHFLCTLWQPAINLMEEPAGSFRGTPKETSL